MSSNNNLINYFNCCPAPQPVPGRVEDPECGEDQDHFRKATARQEEMLENLRNNLNVPLAFRKKLLHTIYKGYCYGGEGACGTGFYKIDSPKFPKDTKEDCEYWQENKNFLSRRKDYPEHRDWTWDGTNPQYNPGNPTKFTQKNCLH